MARKKDPVTRDEIAKELREEKPEYMCKTCTRETKYGQTPVYFGHICSNLHKYKCPYCGQQLIKLEEV